MNDYKDNTVTAAKEREKARQQIDDGVNESIDEKVTHLH